MAWQVGVAQTVPLVCYLDGVETAPSAPIVTEVNVAGAGYVAATNDATIEGDAGEVSVLLAAEEMGEWGFVRVTGANGSRGIQPFTSEGDWTATRAGYTDKLNVPGTLTHTGNVATAPANLADLKITPTTGQVDVGAVGGEAVTGIEDLWAGIAGATFDPDTDTLEAIRAAVDAVEAGGGSGGTFAVVTSIARLISDPSSDLLLIRGDTHSVAYRVRDVDSGEWVDLAGTITLTIRHPHDRAVDAPGDPIAEIDGTITEDAVNGDSVAFTITGTDTTGMEIGQDYDYDVQGVNGGVTTTYVRGTVRRTWDVGR